MARAQMTTMLKTLKERIWNLDIRIMDLENALAVSGDEVRRLEKIIDERLGLE